jgi:hypothetical protein
MKTLKNFTLMISFLSLFSSCHKSLKIDNKYLTATAAKNYTDRTHFENSDVLYLDYKMENGLESIFSIDNIQDLTIQTNAQTIKEFTPIERLTSRLKSIEEDTKNPNFGWKHFLITEQPRAFTFKGFKAAEATFTVEENFSKTRKAIKKKIKRMIVFTDTDLWNFVLAPSEFENYDNEMQIFNRILESIEIKK